MMWGRGFGYWGNMMGFGWVGWLLMLMAGAAVVAIVVVAVLWAVRISDGHGTHPQPWTPARHDEAVAIARRRLASGEIDRGQYEEIMRTLRV